MAVDLEPADLARRARRLYSDNDVRKAITRMAKAMNAALGDRQPLLALPVMNGAMFFASRLLQELRLDLQCSYVHASRYHGQEGGELEWSAWPEGRIEGFHVLLLDDILDEGATLEAISRRAHEDGALSVTVAVLTEKQHSRRLAACPKADFVGLTVPDRYVFGYGMDIDERCRHWPGIYVLEEVL